jgi:tetratricopeptide (TPR) repeat protein
VSEPSKPTAARRSHPRVAKDRARTRTPAAGFLLAILLIAIALAAWVRIGGVWLRGRPVRQHLSAGIQFANQGLGPQAEDEWKAALRLDPRCADACRLLAEYYLSAHAWQKALAALDRLRELAPKEDHLDCRLAACFLNLGDEVSAFRYSEAELKRDPNCTPALATSSILLNDMGEKPRAVAYLRRLGHLEPDDAALQFLLGETLNDTYAYREARPVLEHVLRLDPSNSEAYAQLGIGWMDDAAAPDHFQRAEQALRKSLELNPLNGEARLALGRLYLQERQPRAALPQLEEAVRIMPQSSRAAFELAQACDQTGRQAEAARMRQRFLTFRETSDRVSTLQKLQSLNPAVFDYPLELGTTELRRGNYRRAFIWLHKAQSLRPGDPRVAAALQQLSRATSEPSRMAAVQDQIARGAAGAASQPGERGAAQPGSSGH